MCTEERPCEDTARRQPYASQEERLLQKPTLLESGPRSWTSSLLCYEKISVYYLSHPVSNILFWQPEQTHTGAMLA